MEKSSNFFKIMENSKQDILTLSLDEIKNFLTKKGEKAFRAKQIYEWLWKKPVISFDSMTNLSKDLRNLLKENYTIQALEIDNMQIVKVD